MPPAPTHLRGSANSAAPRQGISTPKELAARMAQLAQRLRDAIAGEFAADRPSGFLVKLRNAGAAALLPELPQPANTEQFADMIAQTVVYGLFAARCAQFQPRAATAAIPTADSFLRHLFETIMGPEFDREPYAGLIANLTQLLADTHLDAILESLRRRGAGPDPVLRFYETFLAAYDPRLRKARGVYYTPEPVVSFIVRAVDDLLKARFGVAAGLAEQGTRPRVLIVDPACGTGSFLSSVVGLIRARFLQQSDLQTWSSYVRSSLLPRLHGFEMLPAPYAVAHLQLGRQLAGHDLPAGPVREQCVHEFASNDRLGVHLTNSLEDMAEQALGNLGLVSTKGSGAVSATPAYAANVMAETAPDPLVLNKQDVPILIVLGNPPYRGISANRGTWIARLLEDYRLVNGAPLGEKKVWLKNDYIKFIRFGQWGIERTGHGILAFITDHSYLDSPTFRGMRQNLLKTFDEIYVLNLHGNAKRRERAPDGSKDENVFDIKQGVAIALFVKQGKEKTVRRVFYEDLWGSRQAKVESLAAQSVATIRWKELSPASPGFEFVRVNRKARAEYQRGWSVKDVFAAGSDKEIFPVASNGVQTSRDHLVVGFSKEDVRERLESFLAPEKTDQQVRHEFFGDKSVGNYPPGDTRQWRLGEARSSLRQTPSWYQAITPYQYRPLDQRSLLYLDSMIDWPRPEVMRHLQQPNYALCIGRAGLVTSGTWDLVFCVNKLCDHNLFYRGSSMNFPLYLYPNGQLPKGLFEEENGLLPNLSAHFVERITEILGLRFVTDKPGDLRRTLGPENILHYAYAVFHSPRYRRRYAEFLRYDFPRLPLTADVGLFRALCRRGEKLVRLHLLEKRPPASASFPIKGDDIVQRVCYLEPGEAVPQGRVWINATQYFEGVAPEVWRFHIGGYRVCHKWLKDRKGRRLSYEDRSCYGQIVGALSESIRLTQDIDAVIEQHGGWPIDGTA